MKRLRLLAAVLTACMSIVLLAGCGDATPSDAVRSEIDSAKTSFDDEFDIEDTMGLELTEQNEAKLEKLAKKISDFDYEILDEKISEDGNSAVVTVKITTYDLGMAYLESVTQMLSEYADRPEEMTAENMVLILVDKMNAVEEKKYSKEVKVNVIKDEDGEWDTDLEDNSEFSDAVIGGLGTAVSEANY